MKWESVEIPLPSTVELSLSVLLDWDQHMSFLRL